jgi:hypothetical protein
MIYGTETVCLHSRNIGLCSTFKDGGYKTSEAAVDAVSCDELNGKVLHDKLTAE